MVSIDNLDVKTNIENGKTKREVIYDLFKASLNDSNPYTYKQRISQAACAYDTLLTHNIIIEEK